MDKNVDISVRIDPDCKIPKVIIQTDRKSSLIEKMIDAIERCAESESAPVPVLSGSRIILLEQWDVVRVYSENRRVFVCAGGEVYESRSTLRELEEQLDNDTFVRISRFEIVNLSRIESFDLSFSGTIKVFFKDGSETWVARRYVRDIQEKLREKLRGGERHE